MTEEEILNTLDNTNDGAYCSFVELGHVYSYLIDSRLNIFRSENNQWAIAIERLGYNPRASAIILDIFYYGNCLINLETYNENLKNYYSIYPIESLDETLESETLKSEIETWNIRSEKVQISKLSDDYLNAGIKLRKSELKEINVENVARLLVTKHRDLFRATDKELYKSIPTELSKILVIDEWHHKDFQLAMTSPMTDEHIKYTLEFNQNLGGLQDFDFEGLKALISQQGVLAESGNRKIWKNNRPSSYETWQLIAKTIVSNDTSIYQPTLKPNTHWKNWKKSGSM
jgi:hypothetical protein